MAQSTALSSLNISASGLTAERLRMDVIANNIANMHSTQTLNGGPYRRQQVSFAALMDNVVGGQLTPVESLSGVRVTGVSNDQSPLPRIFDPGHPDADPEGYVTMPNVSLPREMVDLITASRAYEANLKSLEVFRQMAEQSLSLMRGLG